MGMTGCVSKDNCSEIQKLEKDYEINKTKNLDKCKEIVAKMAEYFKKNNDQSSYFCYKFHESNYCFLKGNYETAYIYGLEGINRFENVRSSYYYARLVNFLGMISSVKGDNVTALEYYLDANEICKDINLVGFRGIIFNNLGCLYDDVKDYETALRYYTMCNMYNKDDAKGIARKFISYINCAIDAIRLKKIDETKCYINSAKLIYKPSFEAERMTSIICVEALIAFAENNMNIIAKKVLKVYELMCEDKVLIDGISELITLIEVVINYDNELAEKLLKQLIRIEKKFKVEQYDIDTAQLWVDIARAKKDNEFIFKALENYSELSKKKEYNDNLIKRNNLNSKIKLHEIIIKNKHIREQLQIDSLTKLYNRKALETVCAIYFHRAIYENKKIALGLADLDSFKQLNDNYGHLSGDDALVRVAGIMRSLSDVNIKFLRYGGDEFLIVIFDCNIETISLIAKLIKKEIDLLKIKVGFQDLNDNFLTISQGYYFAVPQKDDTIVDFIKKADDMLYKSKVSKNAISISHE